MAYSGVYTNENDTFTLNKVSMNGGFPFAEFYSAANKQMYQVGTTAGSLLPYVGDVEGYNAFVQKLQTLGNNYIGSGSDITYFTGLVDRSSPNPDLQPMDPSLTQPVGSGSTSGGGSSSSAGGGTGGGGGSSSTFQSLLDQINSTLSGIQSSSAQVQGLNLASQSLGNASYNLMTQMQGQLSTLLGQSKTSTQQALSNLINTMSGVGTGQQALAQQTIDKMNKLATKQKRTPVTTESTKQKQTINNSVLLTKPTLLGL